MSRFTDDVVEERFDRQQGLCAICDEELVWKHYRIKDEGAWHAHHIDGNPENNPLSNCACVCYDCHFNECHSGDWESGDLLAKSEFALNR